MSATTDETAIPPAKAPAVGMRWRLIPAGLLMAFGILVLILIAGILGTLIAEKYADFKAFDGANSPELSRQSLMGMGLLASLGLAMFAAGRLIWRRKFVIGLLVAALCYPLGAFGTKWMLSSPVPAPHEVPGSNQPRPQRFDDRRRKPAAPLASLPPNFNRTFSARIAARILG